MEDAEAATSQQEDSRRVSGSCSVSQTPHRGLTNVTSETGDCELLKLAFNPNLVCSICKTHEAA